MSETQPGGTPQSSPQGGGSGQGMQPGGNPPPQNYGLSEAQLKELQGNLYSKFQSDLDTYKGRAEKAERELGTWQKRYESIENVEELEKRAKKAEGILFEAEAATVRNRIVAEKFPALKGKEYVIPLGTEADMTSAAEKIVADFGIKGQPSGATGGDPTIKAPATGGGETEVNLDALVNMSPDELKAFVSKIPTDELRKIMARPEVQGYISKHSAEVGGKGQTWNMKR